ncbi:hypothetical protein GYMLUDRAFT_251074 [Collybiopsis luxurians FD-317 M1]|uniref:Unplaced genomic scaffold GYMLUscaffold_92, whole genome shotgun sequence n=1 Tax=Collybiopsis luxurians FD-317 M1 TaxID=944289 RepID=A0A0D0AQI2_9AGAR|nr:hypothetical protein GYMLUDRAFT_251074 [Collybiopsis luxurians FD-317 M1]
MEPFSTHATAAAPSIPCGFLQMHHFPLSPHLAPVQLELNQIVSLSDDSSDDELPEPSQLSQLVQKLKPIPKCEVRCQNVKTDRDDSLEDSDESMAESTQNHLKAPEK